MKKNWILLVVLVLLVVNLSYNALELNFVKLDLIENDKHEVTLENKGFASRFANFAGNTEETLIANIYIESITSLLIILILFKDKKKGLA